MIAIARREFFAISSPATCGDCDLPVERVIFPYEHLRVLLAREASLRWLFEWMMFLFTIILPAISMRLLAEERKLGTMEILLTLPVDEFDVVVGKLVGSIGFLLVALSLTLFYPLMLVILGQPDPGPILGGYIGVTLAGAAYLAIGLLASSWTSSQITAFIIAIAICAGMSFADRIPEALGLHSLPLLDAFVR